MKVCGPFHAPKCCVYFLHKSGIIVYVGQSKSGLSRIQHHRDRKGYEKDFDSFSYIECSIDNLDEIEFHYINVLRPKYNARVGRFDSKRSYYPTADEVLNNRPRLKLPIIHKVATL